MHDSAKAIGLGWLKWVSFFAARVLQGTPMHMPAPPGGEHRHVWLGLFVLAAAMATVTRM